MNTSNEKYPIEEIIALIAMGIFITFFIIF